MNWVTEGPLVAPFDNVGEIRDLEYELGRDIAEGQENVAAGVAGDNRKK